MPQIIIGGTILTVWSAGIQVQQTHLSNKTFYSKHAIASLGCVVNSKSCSLLYVPVHTQNQISQSIITWDYEKPTANYAEKAYQFIMTHLYNAGENDLIIDSGLYT